MSVLGVIVEYNPLHNGHVYHIKTSKLLSNSDYVIAVISGNFVQRGEPAIVNKWERTKMALYSGVDLVIELPVVYSTSTAENFAYGAVKLLDSLNIVDYLCFGSEYGSLDKLSKIAEVLNEEPMLYKKYLKQYLDNGITFASAREIAIKKIIKTDIGDILKSSNNILAIEYLKSLQILNSKIKPLTITRKGASYNSLVLTGEFASAASIRKNIFEGHLNDLDNYIPSYTKEILQNCFSRGMGPVSLEDFSKIILYKLRSGFNVNNIFDVSEGLENRIFKASKLTNNIHELIKLIKSKRYTQSRIRHILIHILLEINYSLFYEFNGPNYIRVLGFNNKGLSILKKIKQNSNIPIITKVANYKKILKNKYEMFEKDLFATDVYTLSYKNGGVAGLDFTYPLVKI